MLTKPHAEKRIFSMSFLRMKEIFLFIPQFIFPFNPPLPLPRGESSLIAGSKSDFEPAGELEIYYWKLEIFNLNFPIKAFVFMPCLLYQ